MQLSNKNPFYIQHELNIQCDVCVNNYIITSNRDAIGVISRHFFDILNYYSEMQKVENKYLLLSFCDEF